MQLESTFAGVVDSFEKGVAAGWALDFRRPADSIGIDLYADGARVATCTADLPRRDLAKVSPISQKKGFRLSVTPYIVGLRWPRLELYFANSNQRIRASPLASRFINRPVIDLMQLASSIGYSEFFPRPPAEIVRHISGNSPSSEEEQKRSYLTMGMMYAADLYNVALDLGLDVRKPGFRIVDLGCGSGRYAPFLKQHMPDSKYLGVDVWPPAISWAQETISAIHPDARFVLLDNLSGYAGANAYILPVEDKSTDMVMSVGVFSHLSVDTTLNYFREIGRILSDDGVALLTFHLLADDTKLRAEETAQRARLPMTKTSDAWWFGQKGCLRVWHELGTIRRIAEDTGLKLIAVRRGAENPAGRPHELAAHQDMIMLRPSAS